MRRTLRCGAAAVLAGLWLASGCGSDDEPTGGASGGSSGQDAAAGSGGSGGSGGAGTGGSGTGGTATGGSGGSGGSLATGGTAGVPEQTGRSCEQPSDCYPNVDAGALSGDAVCLDRVEDGYCTHVCETDEDCCAAPGECQTDLEQVCSPFESTGMKFCFLSCEDEDLRPAADAGVDAGDVDPDEYCRREAHVEFICRSTGGGSENRRVCLPAGTPGDGGGMGGAAGTGGTAGAAGASGASGTSGGGGIDGGGGAAGASGSGMGGAVDASTDGTAGLAGTMDATAG